MSRDSRTPVIVGVAQVLERTDDFRATREPLALMIDASRRAAEDARAPGLLARVEAVRVIRGVWRYGDPGRAIAACVGAPHARTGLSPLGGSYVQTVVSRTCRDIAAGELDVALIAAAECGQAQARARRAGARLLWSEAPGAPDELLGEDAPMSHPAELARGVRLATQMYAMLETALRASLGEPPAVHRARIATLWAGFNAVAVSSPTAWLRGPLTAEEIRTVTPQNRMVSEPYPKRMCANSHVDMGAALILTSEATADRFGVPRDVRVYPHAATDAHDHAMVSWRDALHRSPAIRLAGRRALELAELSVDQVRHYDVYSCFPVAVQVAARELDLPGDRPWTVTGGLTFGGGPLNSYVMHSLARMTDVLRADAGAFGMCTANGGFLTKHAFGIYSTRPPEHAFRYADVQAEVDATPRRDAALEHDGDATIEAYTVTFGAEGPERAHTACRLPDGRRAWANIDDPAVMQAMQHEEWCGRRVCLQDGMATVVA
jgi:acetyl-CoA C-acetyltransferase